MKIDKDLIGYCERVLVIPSENSKYPNVENDSSDWFTSEFYGYYENGIEIWVGATMGYYAIIYNDGSWMVSSNDNDLSDNNVFNSFKAQLIARIPYSNIERIEYEADDWYRDTRIYCKFNIGGNPYEGTYVKPYTPTENHSQFLDNNRRINKKDLK